MRYNLFTLVLGILKPRIYIPFRLKGNESEYILQHEQYHIRRRDYLIKPFSFLLLIVYWFHPLVWIAYSCMGKDLEMSCDEKVLGDMGTSVKNAYSMSLLSFAANHRFPAAGPLAFGESNARGRIKNILRFKKPNGWVSMIIGMLCIIAVISLAANPARKEDKNETVPATDFESAEEVTDFAQQLYEGRNPYIGDAPADGALLKTLGIQEKFGDYTLELETSRTPFILKINYKDELQDRDLFGGSMLENAALLLALIDNADEIQWSSPRMENGQKTLITVYYNQQDLNQLGIADIKSYGESAERVQELIDIMESKYNPGTITTSKEGYYVPDTNITSEGFTEAAFQ